MNSLRTNLEMLNTALNVVRMQASSIPNIGARLDDLERRFRSVDDFNRATASEDSEDSEDFEDDDLDDDCSDDDGGDDSGAGRSSLVGFDDYDPEDAEANV